MFLNVSKYERFCSVFVTFKYINIRCCSRRSRFRGQRNFSVPGGERFTKDNTTRCRVETGTCTKQLKIKFRMTEIVLTAKTTLSTHFRLRSDGTTEILPVENKRKPKNVKNFSKTFTPSPHTHTCLRTRTQLLFRSVYGNTGRTVSVTALRFRGMRFHQRDKAIYTRETRTPGYSPQDVSFRPVHNRCLFFSGSRLFVYSVCPRNGNTSWEAVMRKQFPTPSAEPRKKVRVMDLRRPMFRKAVSSLIYPFSSPCSVLFVRILRFLNFSFIIIKCVLIIIISLF